MIILEDIGNKVHYLQEKIASEIYIDLFSKKKIDTSDYILPETIGELFLELNASLTNERFLSFISFIKSEYCSNDSANGKIKDMSSILRVIPELEQLLDNEDNEAAHYLFKYMILVVVIVLTEISIKRGEKTLDLEKYYIKDTLSKAKISQSAIAKEWGIDSDTLSKWFKILFGDNVFKGRKKITFEEYKDIYRRFFYKEIDDNLLKEGVIIDSVDMDKLISLVTFKGNTFSKKDIIELGFDLEREPTTKDYNRAKLILSKEFEYYNQLNKFPNSLACQLIACLKEH